MKKKPKTKAYARLDKKGYVFSDGRMLMVVPIATLRKCTDIRAAHGITDEQMEALG